MEIRIAKPEISGYTPIIGERAHDFFSRQRELIGDGVNTLEREALDVLSHCIDPRLDCVQSTTSLAVGYVQSGKTLSFTALSALASDNGFRVIIYLAGLKDNLVSQTADRLREDLLNDGRNNSYYKLHENPTDADAQRIKSDLLLPTKPAVLITIHKNPSRLNKLIKLLKNRLISGQLGNKPVLIIDDEADQASLNGYAYSNSRNGEADWTEDKFTATYSAILRLRAALPNHSYVQYTATPQGPLLISLLDLLSPKHHTVLTPGKGYVGGKTFFKDEPGLVLTIPEDQVYNFRRNNLDKCPPSLKDALQMHVLAVVLVVNFFKKENFLSMMIHVDVRRGASQKFKKWVDSILEHWNSIIESGSDDIAYGRLIKSFEQVYPEAIREYEKHGISCPSFDVIKKHIPGVILDTKTTLVISGLDVPPVIKWTDYSSHILIGAEMLNRGFTIKNLAISYMPRYSIGRSMADTIQQRCRFFGYKENYLWSCRVYLPVGSQMEYVEYVEHEEEMRKWLKDNPNIETVERLLLISPNLNPTRKSILSVKTVSDKLKGWRLTNAVQAIDENCVFVENFLAGLQSNFRKWRRYNTVDRNHRYVKLPIEQVIDFLSGFRFQNFPDSARKEATLRYMKYHASHPEKPVSYAYIIQMAYAGKSRVRGFDAHDLRISNLHSGRSGVGNDVYPGDKSIKFDDSICIQIHRIKLDCDSVQWGGKELYTLAIYYPDQLAINYVNATQG